MVEGPIASNFSAALSVWKGEYPLCRLIDETLQVFSLSLLASHPVFTEVNLHELQRTLDAQGLEIVENQKENVVGRKKLAEQTRGKASLLPSTLDCLTESNHDDTMNRVQESTR